jgi:hypothetical protein
LDLFIVGLSWRGGHGLMARTGISFPELVEPIGAKLVTAIPPPSGDGVKGLI